MADDGGLNYWKNKLTDDASLVEIENEFAKSDEARKYAVKCAYKNVFNRNADSKGLEFWTEWLKSHLIAELYEQFTKMKKNGAK